jgi:hypothetical protein
MAAAQAAIPQNPRRPVVINAIPATQQQCRTLREPQCKANPRRNVMVIGRPESRSRGPGHALRNLAGIIGRDGKSAQRTGIRNRAQGDRGVEAGQQAVNLGRRPKYLVAYAGVHGEPRVHPDVVLNKERQVRVALILAEEAGTSAALAHIALTLGTAVLPARGPALSPSRKSSKVAICSRPLLLKGASTST